MKRPIESETDREAPTGVLLDFRNRDVVGSWFPIDDVVMGGVSASRVAPVETGLEFAGEVSLEHGGGFASIRSREGLWDLADGSGLRLRYRGDGRTYKLRLATSAGFDGVRYQAAFPTKAGEWETRDLPFDAFEPVFRGRSVPEAGPLDASHVTSFGFLISDRQAGPFRLEVAWIDVVDRSAAGGR